MNTFCIDGVTFKRSLQSKYDFPLFVPTDGTLYFHFDGSIFKIKYIFYTYKNLKIFYEPISKLDRQGYGQIVVRDLDDDEFISSNLDLITDKAKKIKELE